MNANDKMVFVVRDLNVLIKEYGLKEVKHALNFISDYPKTEEAEKRTMRDQFGNTYMVTDDQFQAIRVAYAGGANKIQAIKLFREITGCGLKEAKDLIETHFNWVRPSDPKPRPYNW